MDFFGMIGAAAQPVVAFLAVFTLVVFVHELGHYWFARRFGVRVLVFSVGFGRELFGFTDRAGTRWKFSLVPLGGYVKMFGQNDLGPDGPDGEMSADERRSAYCCKSVGRRAAIAAAGPLANFVLAVLILAVAYVLLGQSVTPPRVQEVRPDSPAAHAGVRAGDVIVEVAGRGIRRFEEVQQVVGMYPDLPLEMVVERAGGRVRLAVTPAALEVDDGLGGGARIGFIGVVGVGRESVRLGPADALLQAVRATAGMVSMTFTGLRQIVLGERAAEEIGGPLRIAHVTAAAAEAGIWTLIHIAAFLSVNLGIINLLPVPLLDGGHLAFHAWEAVRGRPPGRRAQEVGAGVGLVLVVSLMLFATWNDVTRLSWVRQVVDLVVS